MQMPEDVAQMLRLKAAGLGIKQIAREIGCSKNTVRRYLRSGGWVAYRVPRRKGVLNGLEAWLAERFQRHGGNADVVRQDLEREHGVAVSLFLVLKTGKSYVLRDLDGRPITVAEGKRIVAELFTVPADIRRARSRHIEATA
jgi:hypothetical protein